MDYILLSSLIKLWILMIIASYDIACQYFTNFSTHILDLLKNIQAQKLSFRPMVSKVHIVGHGTLCQRKHLFN